MFTVIETEQSKRRHFPLFGKATGPSCDIDKIRAELSYLEEINGWKDMTLDSELVKNLIKGRECLTSKFQDNDGAYTNYHQILLTEFNSSDSAMPDRSVSDRLKNYKLDVKRTIPELDERNYNRPRAFLDKTPELKKVLNHFSDRLMRARFAKIKAGFSIKPHIDYDTTYGIRLHLAINTNDQCFLWARRSKSENFEKFFVPDDGCFYFVNAGFEHYASNEGLSDRSHLVLSIYGQQDIAHLKL